MSPHYGILGGVHLIIDALAGAARATGHEVAAVIDADGRRPPPWALGATREVVLYPFPDRLLDPRRLPRFTRKFPVGATRLVRAVRAFAPDVVSVHCMRRFAPYAALLRRTTGVPQVLNLQEAALPPGTPQHERLFRMLVGAADAVAACSAEAAAYATRVGRGRRVTVIPNGYDPAEFRGGPVFAHPRPYVLGLGRLEWQKGFDELIEALALLRKVDLDLLLAGDGAGRAALVALAAARGVADRVHFLGRTERSTTLALLRGAAVVACPSRFEGLPLVCIEALAAGRPLVASAVNGIPEVVRDGQTGLLVPPDDPAALARALGHLLAVPADAARLAARGRAEVERRNPWPAVAAAWLALCRDVVGGGRIGVVATA